MFETLRLVLFLLIVNALPPLIALLSKGRFSQPLDCGKTWLDGKRIFGRNKTIRGILAGIVGGTLLFPLLGQPISIAFTAALLAMLGDLSSSFIKRRMALPSGSEVAFLDQLFESLFPTIYLALVIPFGFFKAAVILFLFVIIAYLSSRIWSILTVADIPEDYPRTVSSAVRYKEWKSCHTPYARMHVWFNLTNILSDQILLTFFFKATGLYGRGEKNARAIRVEEKIYFFDSLPEEFNGFRIAFLTDLHLDGMEGIADLIKQRLDTVDFDLLLIGGDIRMKTYGSIQPAITELQSLMEAVDAPYGTFGVLGNHDCLEMLPEMEDARVIMLVNDSAPITKGDSTIWIAGVDDPHYYNLAAPDKAVENIPDNDFIIFLSHSPEPYIQASFTGARLFLCGHTHGGQICLKEGKPIITNSRAPRFTASGPWHYQGMHGYTSRGVGTSSIPVRLNCPAEIVVITLDKST